MRSFATITFIIAAALSTFTNAAPIALPGVPLPANIPSVDSKVTSVTQTVDFHGLRRDTEISASIEPEEVLPQSTPSVAVVFTNLFTQIRPLTDQLSKLSQLDLTPAYLTLSPSLYHYGECYRCCHLTCGRSDQDTAHLRHLSTPGTCWPGILSHPRPC